MYAITVHSFRSITSADDVGPGETFVTEVPSELLHAIACEEARQQRDALLRGSDWTQMPDTPLSGPQRDAWVTYRQQLRDLPATQGWPVITWPIAPTAAGVATAT